MSTLITALTTYGTIHEGYHALNVVTDSSAPTPDRIKALGTVIASSKAAYETVKPAIDATGKHISMRAHRANELEYKGEESSILDKASKKAYEAVYGKMPPPPKNCCEGCCIVM